jgi:hypothetical protein
MFLLDSLMISGIRWALETVVTAAETEMNDDTVLREQLLEAEMRRELGEIDADAFRAIESDLLARIRTIRERREQHHLLRLNEYLDPLNPTLREYLTGLRSALTPVTGDTAVSEAISYQVVENLRQQQALSLSFFDVFFVSALVAAGLIVLALLMRRSVAEKGAHLAAE